MKSLAEIMTFHLRRPRVTNFPDIIKVSTMFIKTTFNDSKKVGNWKLCLKTQSISVFLDKTKVVDFREKILTSAELKRCVT